MRRCVRKGLAPGLWVPNGPNGLHVGAMTATNGPGFSLKQENLGYASAVEIPCVVANVMRGGPSTGMPTRPAQADIMQAR